MFNIARRVNQHHRPQFDYGRFTTDFTGKESSKALKEDLRKYHINRINLLPTITFTRDGKGIKLEGKKSYQQLVQALTQFMSPAELNTMHCGTLQILSPLIEQKPTAKLLG